MLCDDEEYKFKNRKVLKLNQKYISMHFLYLSNKTITSMKFIKCDISIEWFFVWLLLFLLGLFFFISCFHGVLFFGMWHIHLQPVRCKSQFLHNFFFLLISAPQKDDTSSQTKCVFVSDLINIR